ncbi:MAG: hypothetical protein R3C53_16530 [Pirellulaceae bacterium]
MVEALVVHIACRKPMCICAKLTVGLSKFTKNAPTETLGNSANRYTAKLHGKAHQAQQGKQQSEIARESARGLLSAQSLI